MASFLERMFMVFIHSICSSMPKTAGSESITIALRHQIGGLTTDFTSGKVSISTVSTGGLGDMYIFLSAQKPESIIAKYHSLIG
jgi:hypothetical protein